MTQEIERHEWTQAVAGRLQRKSRTEELNSCIRWEGAMRQTQPNAPKYSYMKVQLPDSHTKKSMRVHVLAYLVANIRLRDVLLSKDKGFDISHLCHHSLCINLEHLIAEDRALNNLRKACTRSGRCLRYGGHRECLL
ncbi:hypothetical protein HOLleu_19131 [Holothuria leucospilota]|uniref:Zinc-binding loop region of homing endonuclease domain-containing protein n=1 Tax=Holothuria leucospilota TaxID=206669 RepID=A0A9Q1H762_HOLLE|nr:hypothetical protein HOLleu_19131 [Holothuria leucospilota]